MMRILVNQEKKLKAIKDKLALNIYKSTLFDAPLFTKNLEHAYERMCDS